MKDRQADKSGPIAMLFGPLRQQRRIADALSQAGWQVAGITAADSAMLLVHDADVTVPDAAAHARFEPVRICVGDPTVASGPAEDARITGREPAAELAALFARWLPPGCDELDRMAQAFGRAQLSPLVENVRVELSAALALLAEGAQPDAHKLAGLTGTIGFIDASRAWQALDEAGGPSHDARRTTRMAVVTIDRWLAG